MEAIVGIARQSQVNQDCYDSDTHTLMGERNRLFERIDRQVHRGGASTNQIRET